MSESTAKPKLCQAVFRLTILASAIAWTVTGAPHALAQAGAAAAEPSATSTSAGKSFAFEVVSVRQNLSRCGRNPFGPTLDGYRMTCQPLLLAIMAAYIPQSGSGLFARDNTQGMPEWTLSENYDIDAKVSEADLPKWQEPASQPAMLRAMLQDMLADRFKLAAHREMKEVPVYSLIVAKSGRKFKETTPGEPHPGTMAIPGGGGFMNPGDGGQKVQFYDTTMTTFASIFSNLAGRPIQDKTGLTGRYDLVFQKPSRGSPSSGQEAADPSPTIFSAMEDLGLKLVPTKGSVETLVIDHIERPSEN